MMRWVSIVLLLFLVNFLKGHETNTANFPPPEVPIEIKAINKTVY